MAWTRSRLKVIEEEVEHENEDNDNAEKLGGKSPEKGVE
jgi:hypothetical protein